MLHESYYDCQVYVDVKSVAACATPSDEFVCRRNLFHNRCEVATAGEHGVDLDTCMQVCIDAEAAAEA
jgi:hypothetical protein